MKRITTVGLALGCFILQAQTYDWVITTGGPGFDYSNDMAVDAAGNSYTTGWIQDSANFQGTWMYSTGGQDFFIAKYNTSGVLQWVRTGGGISGNDQGYGIDVDAAGNVYAAGSFTGSVMFGTIPLTSYGLHDMFVIKYDAIGNLQWVRQGGSTSRDQANDLRVTPWGSVYIAGHVEGVATFGSVVTPSPSGIDMCLVKYDNAGNALWARIGGGSTTDNIYGLALDKDANAYITGYHDGTSTYGSIVLTPAGAGDDICVVKYDSLGTEQWARSGGGSDQDQANHVQVHGSTVHLTGYYSSTSASFGSFVLPGSGNSVMYHVGYDVATGAETFAYAYPSTAYSQGSAFVEDGAGNQYLLGQFSGVITLGSSTLTSLNTSSGWDILLIQFSAPGSVNWAKRAGSTGFWDTSTDIDVDGSDNVYFTGVHNDNADFDSFILSSVGLTDHFVAKILGTPTGIEEELLGNFSVYPNPTSAQLTIESEWVGSTFALFNTVGQSVLKGTISTQYEVLDLSSVSPGIYFLRLENGLSQRVVVTR